MSSFSLGLSSTMVPKEMGYLMPGAAGNRSTCSVQGFLIGLGTCGASLYNCSICLYYLAIIKYNKKETYIREKLEPWFHVVTVVLPLVPCIMHSAVDSYSPLAGFCFVSSPEISREVDLHCQGYEDGSNTTNVETTPKGFTKPCGKYPWVDHPIIYVVATAVNLCSVILPSLTIIVTMVMMYRSVAELEKKMKRYGVHSLRLRASIVVATAGLRTGDHLLEAGTDPAGGHSTSSIPARNIFARVSATMKKFKKNNFLKNLFSCFWGEDDSSNKDSTRQTFLSRRRRRRRRLKKKRSTRRSAVVVAQKRSILAMAIGYAGAWLVIFIPFLVGVESGLSYEKLLIGASLTPLQGFMNFVVFMSPKVRNAKNPPRKRGEKRGLPPRRGGKSRVELTWLQACFEAYLSRGKKMNIIMMRGTGRLSTQNGNRRQSSFMRRSITTMRSCLRWICRCLFLSFKFNNKSNNMKNNQHDGLNEGTSEE